MALVPWVPGAYLLTLGKYSETAQEMTKVIPGSKEFN